MNALVIFDSQFGNTEQVAHAIATALEPTFSVRLAKAGDILINTEHLDLLIIGGPTQKHRKTAPLVKLLNMVPRAALKGINVATFDTRYRMTEWLSGSAARDIANALKKRGGNLVVPPESFFIKRDVPPQGEHVRHNTEELETGELERAAAWAGEVARAMLGEQPVVIQRV